MSPHLGEGCGCDAVGNAGSKRGPHRVFPSFFGHILMKRQHPSNGSRSGFTLFESLIAISLTAFAGSVMLLATQGTLHTADDNVDEMIANGVAKQLLDELLSQPYMEPGQSPYEATLGPTAWEIAGQGRERFNDTDDYHNYQSALTGLWGQPLGHEDGTGGLRPRQLRIHSQYFRRWTAQISVYYVDENDHSKRLAAGTSNYRAAEVTVIRTNPDGGLRPLASLRRVYAYVPPP